MWAQVNNMTRQAEQTLKNTGTPMTPDKLFFAMLTVLSCSSGVSVDIFIGHIYLIHLCYP